MDIVNLLLNILILAIVGFTLWLKADTADKRKTIARQVKRKFKPEKLGAIEKLTPEEAAKKGTRLEEAEQEMERVLDKVL